MLGAAFQSPVAVERRRFFLLGCALASPAAVLSLPVRIPTTVTVTPIQRLFSEWAPLFAALNGPEASSEGIDGWAFGLARLGDLADQLSAEPPTNPQDLAIKAAVLTDFGSTELGGALALECITMLRTGRTA
jgi:hypothetical protein